MPQVNLAASPKVTAVAVVHERFQSSCFLSACRAFAVSNNSCRARLSSSKAPAAQHVTAIQQQRSQLIARASEEQQQVSAFDYEEPETAKEGIDLGLVLCKQGRCAAGGRTSGSCAQQRSTQGRDCTMPAHYAQWAVLTIQSTQWKLVMRRRMDMCKPAAAHVLAAAWAYCPHLESQNTHPAVLHLPCRWADALNIFEKSLKLPGTGVKRFRSAEQECTAFSVHQLMHAVSMVDAEPAAVGPTSALQQAVLAGRDSCFHQAHALTALASRRCTALSLGVQALAHVQLQALLHRSVASAMVVEVLVCFLRATQPVQHWVWHPDHCGCEEP